MKRILSLMIACLMAISLTACNGTSIIGESSGDNNAPTHVIDTSEPNNTTQTDTVQLPTSNQTTTYGTFSLSIVPDYYNEPVYIVNNNIPYFTPEEIVHNSYEFYSDLDNLGRCQVAIACLSPETQPPAGEKRGEIGMVKPAGWHTVKYPEVISDLYLYNRCHLIGWQLGAENANELNLTTGTRYLNVDGMLPYENMVDDYLEETGNHVMYRVTPIFVNDELVCRGILMEAYSVEDNGAGICFCVYCYNVQPGVEIDYATGDSWLTNTTPSDTVEIELNIANDYIVNTNTMKIHKPDCQYAQSISDKNRLEYNGLISDLLDNGYTICGSCKPD